MHALLLLAVRGAWSSAEIERRDYIVFVEVGRRLLDGALDEVYDGPLRRFPFLHPPPVIVLSAPVGVLEPRVAFVVLGLLSFAALAISILALRRLDDRRDEHDVVWLGLLASAPWSIALVLGQPAPLLLAAYALALAALRHGRDAAAGLGFGALLVKPHLALAPLAWMLVARRRRALAGFAAFALLLGAVSLLAGLARWPEWARAIARAIGEVSGARIALWKQHTWLAFLRGLFPAWGAWLGWALAALPLGALTLRRVRAEASVLRVGALLVLATIALAPYAYFYDALLLVVPAAALWLERERYPRWALASLAVVVALTFAWQHVGFFALQRGLAVGGLLSTAWLGLELAAPLGPCARAPKE